MNCTNTNTSSAPIWAVDRHDMVWRLSDHLWEHWMGRARLLFINGAAGDAGRLWNAADAISRKFVDGDPRRAASLDALGTHALAGGEAGHAADLYHDALAAWHKADDWIATMGVAPSARSSMFHLRLESKYAGAYPEITRRRHAKTCAAGRAGTAANLAASTGNDDGLRDAMADRCEAFGGRESGAAAMAAMLGECARDDVIDRWRERPPQRYDDERRLYAAALLAPVLAKTGTSS